mmetsp:Transcript_5616/g.14612  ORF Transcript_5616/g.14612 Transcript_5616/m.14612 type:complete len:203 (+) Transcript_5616:201-809(+)
MAICASGVAWRLQLSILNRDVGTSRNEQFDEFRLSVSCRVVKCGVAARVAQVDGCAGVKQEGGRLLGAKSCGNLQGRCRAAVRLVHLERSLHGILSEQLFERGHGVELRGVVQRRELVHGWARSRDGARRRRRHGRRHVRSVPERLELSKLFADDVAPLLVVVVLFEDPRPVLLNVVVQRLEFRVVFQFLHFRRERLARYTA